MIIVIDGPAGAGKSTTAREVARRAGLDYVDSGAIYRAFTVLFNHYDKDQTRFLNSLDQHSMQFEFRLDQARVLLDQKEITDTIRMPQVNDHVSEVAKMPVIRQRVREILQNTSKNKKVIMEGRDLGTVVFPDAEIKFFLTADARSRAQRRFDELQRNGETVSFEEVCRNVEKRDQIDSTRNIAPLRKADDAIVIDSSGMSFEEQVARILMYIDQYRTAKIY